MPPFVKLLAAALSVLSAAAAAQPCTPSPGLHVVKPGTMQMSVNPTLPPQEYVNDRGELLGLNIDLAAAIAKRLCLEPVFIRMDAQGMVPGLNAGRFDMVNNGFFWTAERAKVLFLVPYAQHGFTVITAPNSPLKIASFDDLAGLRLGVESTSYPDVMARRDSAAIVAKGGKPIEIHGFANGAETLAALRANQVDAMMSLDETAASIAKRGGAKLQLVGVWNSQIALAFRDRDLAQASADAMTALKAEGFYDKVFDQYGMTRLKVDRFAIRGPAD